MQSATEFCHSGGRSPKGDEKPMTATKTAIAVFAVFISSTITLAADKITMMFPASEDLPNVSAFQIAKYKHYYSDAGLDAEFLAGHGGVYGGRQAGDGNVDFAEIFGDTAVVLRSQGVPIKMVALMGGQGPVVLAANAQSGIRNLKDLKGKSISILGREDSTYYILLAALASANLKEEDVKIRSLGPSGVIRDFIRGDVQVCACIPEWIVEAEDAGVKMNLIRVAAFLPSLAQSIVTSDRFLAAHPDTVRRFVQATLKAYVELRDNPTEGAKVYADAVPVHEGQEAKLLRIYRYHDRFSWAGQRFAGVIEPQKVEELQDVYYNLHIITKKSSLDSLFTNEFVGGGNQDR